MAKFEKSKHGLDNPHPVKAEAAEQAGHPILVADCPFCSVPNAPPVKVAIPKHDEPGKDMVHCPTCDNVLKLSP